VCVCVCVLLRVDNLIKNFERDNYTIVARQYIFIDEFNFRQLYIFSPKKMFN
jgi:hypothetical protein